MEAVSNKLSKCTYDDFLELSTEELKFFLRQRGQNVSGNKRDLAARALVSFEKGESPKNSDQFEKQIRADYDKILQLHKIRDPLLETNWSDDLTI